MEKSKASLQAAALEKQINAMMDKYNAEERMSDTTSAVASAAAGRAAEIVKRWPGDECFMAVEVWAELEGVIDDYAKCRGEVASGIKKAQRAAARKKQIIKLRIDGSIVENIQDAKKRNAQTAVTNGSDDQENAKKRTRTSGRISALQQVIPVEIPKVQSIEKKEEENEVAHDDDENDENDEEESTYMNDTLIALCAPRGRQSALDALYLASRSLKLAIRLRAFIHRAAIRLDIISKRLERRSPPRIQRPLIADAAAAFAQKGLDRPDAIEDCMIVWDFISSFRGSRVLPIKHEELQFFPESRLDTFVDALASTQVDLSPLNPNNPIRFLPAIHIWLLRLLLDDKRTSSWWPKPRQNHGRSPTWWYAEWHDKVLKRDLIQNELAIDTVAEDEMNGQPQVRRSKFVAPYPGPFPDGYTQLRSQHSNDQIDIVSQVSSLLRAGTDVEHDKLFRAATAIRAPDILVQQLSDGAKPPPELIAAIHANASLRQIATPTADPFKLNASYRNYAMDHALWVASKALRLAVAESVVARVTNIDTRKLAEATFDAVDFRIKRKRGRRKLSELLPPVETLHGSRRRTSTVKKQEETEKVKRSTTKPEIPLKLDDLVALLRADHQRIVPRPTLDSKNTHRIITAETWPILSAAMAARYIDRNRADDLAHGLDDYDQYEIDLLNTATPGGGLGTMLRAQNIVSHEAKKPLHCKQALKLGIEHLTAGNPYNTLPPRSRCAILRVLVDAAIESYILEDEVTRRSEQLETVDTEMFEDTFHRDKLRENGRLLRNATTHRKKVGLFLIRKDNDYEYEQNSHFVMARIPKYEPSQKRGQFRLELELYRDRELAGSSDYTIMEELSQEAMDANSGILNKLAKAMMADNIELLTRAIDYAKQQPSLFIQDKMITRPLLNAMLIAWSAERVRNDTRAKKSLIAQFRSMPRIRAEQLGRDTSGSIYWAFVGESRYAPSRIWCQLSHDQEVAEREYPRKPRASLDDIAEDAHDLDPTVKHDASAQQQLNESTEESMQEDAIAATDPETTQEPMDESEDHKKVVKPPPKKLIKSRPPTPPPPLILPHVAVHSKNNVPVWGYYGDERTVRQLAASMDQLDRSERALEQELSYRY